MSNLSKSVAVGCTQRIPLVKHIFRLLLLFFLVHGAKDFSLMVLYMADVRFLNGTATEFSLALLY